MWGQRTLPAHPTRPLAGTETLPPAFSTAFGEKATTRSLTVRLLPQYAAGNKQIASETTVSSKNRERVGHAFMKLAAYLFGFVLVVSGATWLPGAQWGGWNWMASTWCTVGGGGIGWQAPVSSAPMRINSPVLC